MRVDFYQLSRDPVDRVVALLARKVMQAGERLVVVSGDAEQREAISQTLWAQDGAAFLAHGEAGGEYAARQPIVLSADCSAPNEARMAIIADGKWREEAGSFARVMLLFDASARDRAAALWRSFAGREDIDNRIFKQTVEGAWREGA